MGLFQKCYGLLDSRAVTRSQCDPILAAAALEGAAVKLGSIVDKNPFGEPNMIHCASLLD